MKTTLFTNSKLLIASALMAGITLMPMTASAGKHGGTGDGINAKKIGFDVQKNYKRMAKHLNLSKEQKSEVKAIHEKHRSSNEAQRVSMQAYQAEVKALIASGNFTDASFSDIYNKYEDELEQKALRKAQVKNEVYQVLTDEQKVKWKNYVPKNRKGRNK